MAIEPIGTATVVQMQSVARVQPAPKSESQNTDVVSEQTSTPKLDDTTEKVAKVLEGDADNKQDSTNQREADQENLKKAVDDLNKKMVNSEAVFGIHEGTNRVTIKLVDKNTRETIKELPPEKTLDMIAKVWEMAGILVDEKR